MAKEDHVRVPAHCIGCVTADDVQAEPEYRAWIVHVHPECPVHGELVALRAEVRRLQHELAMAQTALKIAGNALDVGLAEVEWLRERRETAAQFVEAARRRGSIGPTSAQILLGYLRDASAATTGEDEQ